MPHRLTKHHGLGNDFLVALVEAGEGIAPGPDEARALCDRRRGVGADGLIVGGRAAEAELAMVLYNADGSRAEMSGNGIRCLAQAEARRQGVDHLDVTVATDGGLRRCRLRPGPDPVTALVSVAMGVARPGPEPTATPAGAAVTPAVKAGTVDLGNPHLVLLVEDPAAIDLSAEGSVHEARFAGGVNVEFIAPTPGRADHLTLTVWERGAGITDACGTGATAAAHLAHEWGLVGEEVTVGMPGGDVQVVLGGAEDGLTLVGPATYVATVEVPT